jgi:hypothetical protein
MNFSITFLIIGLAVLAAGGWYLRCKLPLFQSESGVMRLACDNPSGAEAMPVLSLDLSLAFGQSVSQTASVFPRRLNIKRDTWHHHDILRAHDVYIADGLGSRVPTVCGFKINDTSISVRVYVKSNDGLHLLSGDEVPVFEAEIKHAMFVNK